MFIVDINFNEASREWRKNKKYLGNGSFQYIRTNKKEDQIKTTTQLGCIPKHNYNLRSISKHNYNLRSLNKNKNLF